jgi:hypothetical protein
VAPGQRHLCPIQTLLLVIQQQSATPLCCSCVVTCFKRGMPCCAVLCHQVHGSDAEAAGQLVTWSQMPGLVLQAARIPLLWYFAISSFSCERVWTANCGALWTPQ